MVNRESGCLFRYNADGTYDPSFNFTGGESVLAVAEIGSQLLVAVTPNRNSPAYRNEIGFVYHQVLRLNSDGSVDSSFSSNALANNFLRWITVQSDGKILVAGDFDQFAGTPRQYIARLLPSGQLDTSFIPPPFTGGGLTNGYKPVVQPDGRIIITGNFTAVNGITRPRVARLNPDGSHDTSFAPSGFTNTTLVRGALVQPNGQIVIAGRFTVPASYAANPSGRTYNYLPLLRLNANGSADQSFGCFEPSFFSQSAGFLRARDVIIQDDGKYLALTSGGIGSVFRFNSNGSLDTGFHRPAFRSFLPGTSDYFTGTPTSLVLEPAGTMLIAGAFNSIDNDGVARYGVARFQADGTGMNFVPEVSGLFDYPSHAARLNDGRHAHLLCPAG